MADPNYTIWIKTGDQALGGTDSNVFIMLIGDQGRTDWIHLPAQDIFAFEQGATDKFMLVAPEVGELQQCCVGHDNSADSGWYVEQVQVEHMPTNKSWTFEFKEWLGEEEAGRLSVCVDC